ncbi:NADH dehydrogenase [Mycobacterium antarcticum]|uniref:proton-conducting transporter transmembrane domain-containing protein n=1 Tax=Mycolicibacterium sp. TUM20983 TaxID=3023369 RepID=UPI0023940291|nr:proton-conducting transporter membrane subunit [Mycolicibacterium sp. TUM20983]GLP74920.1 NADH dehydrogenase [Mycolicibacterium sp. TUM20983]
MLAGILMAMLVVPATVAPIALMTGKWYPRPVGHVGVLAAGLGLIGAAVLAVRAADGAVVSAVFGGLAVSADQLAAVMLLLVFGVSVVVQSFAVRYLAGDPRAPWFVAGASLITAASAGLVTAATLIGLALAWTLAGAALCLLLGTYWHLPAGREGVKRTVTAFLIGDLALWTAVVLVTVRWGTVDLRAADPVTPTGPVAPVVACLIVVAALSRSSQIPFHGWLPATLAAPTPVSALLHAGVVNAGGILLIRLSPLVTGNLARTLIIVAGAATMVYGAAVMLVKPDVKGALAHSTMAQMGFMILTCGLGLWAAAVFHLVAHGFYKATLFLSSGSAIAHHRRQAASPPAGPLRPRVRRLDAIVAAALPAAGLVAAALTLPAPIGDHTAGHALLLFAWVTGASMTWGWLQRRPGAGGILAAGAVLVPVSFLYVGLINAVGGFLVPALPAAVPATVTVWLIAAAALGALGLLAVLRWSPGRLHRAVYARVLTAGHVPMSLPRRLTGAPS